MPAYILDMVISQRKVKTQCIASLFSLFLLIIMISCNVNNETKVPVYAWESGPGKLTDKELLSRFKDYNEKGIDGLMYSAGQDD